MRETRVGFAAVGGRRFGRFALARVQSWVGAYLTLVALPLLVYQRTGSAGLTAALTALEATPYLLFGLVAGAVGDRWDRRHLLVVTCSANALALVSVPVADLLGALSLAHVFVVAGLVASLNVFADAGTFGALPMLVDRDRLAEANARLSAAGTIVGVAAPPVGGWLAAVVGPVEVLWVESATFAVAAVVFAGLGDLGRRDPQPTAVRTMIAQGLEFVWSQPLVRWLTLLGIGVSASGGAVTGLLVVLPVEEFGLGSDDPRIGWLFATAAAGSFVATLVLPRLSRRVRAGAVGVGGMTVGWVSLLAWAGAPSLGWAFAALFCWQLVSTTVVVNGIVARQLVTPGHLQSRVNTTARMIAWGGQPIGAALAGALAETWSARTAVLVVGASLAVSGAIGLLAGVWRLGTTVQDDEPAA